MADMRTHKRRTAARVLHHARFMGDLRAEMEYWDDADDCMRALACGSCGAPLYPDEAVCWHCGEDL